mmetsp:Transcript_36478/g.56626  ORF Transcript_36478/g.56626 Transcript_36478/m.56626 type:complete len:242 (+) Transcript_36478:150-875(+)
MLQLEDLPKECFNQVCAYLPVPDVNLLSQSSTTFRDLVHKDNNELWNLLLCQRLWTIDPCAMLLEEEDHHALVDWRGAFRDMVRAERDHQIHLDELRRLNLSGWLERHFLGDMALYWQGWERRYWSWDGNSIVAWADASRTHCYAQFPVSAKSAARRVSPEEQVKLGKARIDGDYSITPKPFVFTIENTAFDLLFACKSEEELQLWLDKISVTLHPLKYSGRTYKAPAKYIMQKNTKRKRN